MPAALVGEAMPIAITEKPERASDAAVLRDRISTVMSFPTKVSIRGPLTVGHSGVSIYTSLGIAGKVSTIFDF